MVPRHLARFHRNIVSCRGRKRNNLDALITKLRHQHLNVFFYFHKAVLAVTHQIHLIYGKHKALDSHQVANSCMALCLNQYALARICQDHAQRGKRSSYRHISRIFFMSRCIGNDKASVLCCKITIRGINGNSLLTLCDQSVQKQRIVDLSPGASNFGIQFQRFFLVCKKELCVVKHMADQR